jgi:hypothetical protein
MHRGEEKKFRNIMQKKVGSASLDKKKIYCTYVLV